MTFRTFKVLPRLDCAPRQAETLPTLVVMHSTAKGEPSEARADFAIEVLRERGLSYHYIISKTGVVFECVPPEMKAYHAGSSYGPLEEAKGLSRRQKNDFSFLAGTSVNEYSIGISFVNLDDGADPFTSAQSQAAAKLIECLREKFDSLEWITTHAAVSPGRKVDPLGYDMKGLASAVGLKLWPNL